jgi:enoyl-CoA hydratase
VGLPEVALGVLPGTGGTQRLTRLIGHSRAIQLMVEGMNFDFEEAERFGIVNRVMEADDRDEFLEQVMEYARSFTRPRKASMAVGNIKRACQTGGQLPLEQGLAIERELQAALFNSQDAKEGLNAYVEKRSAEFSGR